MHKVFGILTGIPVLALPLVTLAGEGDGTIDGLLGQAETIISRLIPIIVGVALLLFFIGLVQYVRAGESDESKKKARGLIIYGIIILAVMASVWGLVAFLTDSLGLETGGTIETPDLPF